MYQRPDRYRLIQADLSHRSRIARGGGYSYAAASFGAGSVAQDVGRFNRLLRFDPIARSIEVEAPVTLADPSPSRHERVCVSPCNPATQL
jgi:hypothetical protein